MARIRARDTKPEMLVRRLLHSLGYRFRVQNHRMPGRPDIVFGRRRKIIFVHGCFWHQHDTETCRSNRKPKSNLDYWSQKLDRNVTRDRLNQEALREAGWQVLTIWACEMQDRATLENRLADFLGPRRIDP